MVTLDTYPAFWSEVRRRYSVDQVLDDLRVPRPLTAEAAQLEDVVLLASHCLTSQLYDLSGAKDWYQERLGIDSEFIEELPAVERVPGGKTNQHFAPSPSHTKSVLEPDMRAPDCESPSLFCGEEITDEGASGVESPARVEGKTPTRPARKTPRDYSPVLLRLVVDPVGLKKLLHEHGQDEWATGIRLNGLLSLLDFFIRNQPQNTKEGFFVSAATARGYVSDLSRARSKKALRKPLAVLVQVGLLERVQRHTFTPHVKCSASFRVPSQLMKVRRQEEVPLNPKNEEKRLKARERQDRRLSALYPIRKQLLQDLDKLRLSRVGLLTAIEIMRSSPDKKKTVELMIDATSGRRPMKVNFRPTGHLAMTTSCCLRELKVHLELDGAPVSFCDISHAHFCILPCLLQERIENQRKAGLSPDAIARLEAERDRLIAYLGEGDFYRKLSSDPECDEQRERSKARLLSILNWKNLWTAKDPTFLRMKELFPETMRTVEDIRRNNHKAIQPPLRYYTAQVINEALLRVQQLGIPAIPDTDSIICPAEHEHLVCRIIGEEMHRVSGVCCKVGGHRFSPN
ncbi:MAG TPA: hypothetical protein VGE67_11685 [Haloferula sp.]